MPINYKGSKYEGRVSGSVGDKGYYLYSVVIKHRATDEPVEIHDVKENVATQYLNAAGRIPTGAFVLVQRENRANWVITGIIPDTANYQEGDPSTQFQAGNFSFGADREDGVSMTNTVFSIRSK